MPKRSALIEVKEYVGLKVGRTDKKFVLFNLREPLPDDCLRQLEIKRLVQTEYPDFMPLNAKEVSAYALYIKKNKLAKPLFALYSRGYEFPGDFIGTREIQPGGKVEFRKHWCLGGDLFEWDPKITFIMRVRFSF